ncbi:MAG: gamma-glutamylcyclotransferase [Motiliproteus sp.]
MRDLHASLTPHHNVIRPSLPDGDLWVFAYGSLMWNPAFEYLRHSPARLHGYHRSLCVLSHVHRGTPQQPGMVLGLDRGGCCRGRGFLIAARDKEEITEYLYAREMATLVYKAELHPITLTNQPTDRQSRQQQALCFVVNRQHHQYAGKLDPRACAKYIQQAQGLSGTSQDYLASTLRHLQQLHIKDSQLLKVAAALQPLSPPEN